MSVSVSDIKFEGDTCNFPDTSKPQIVRIFLHRCIKTEGICENNIFEFEKFR